MGVAEATLRSCAQPLRSLVGSVIEEARKFVAGALEADDLTIITVRYRG
jgi:serine phosphatase RsbU (regulator of sigma subunit)